jgi:hypothetical protein
MLKIVFTTCYLETVPKVNFLFTSSSYTTKAQKTKKLGRAIALAVSRWLSTAAARVRARSGHVGFVVDKMALGQVPSAYFGFPCQSSFYQIPHPHNHTGRYIRLISGRRA